MSATLLNEKAETLIYILGSTTLTAFSGLEKRKQKCGVQIGNPLFGGMLKNPAAPAAASAARKGVTTGPKLLPPSGGVRSVLAKKLP